MLVRDTCKSRGQNAYIGAELENMLSKYDSIKIAQSEYRLCDTSKRMRKRNRQP